MKNFIFRPRLARELKRLARENQGKPLSILDDGVFKLLFAGDNEDSREALRSLLSACTRRAVSKVQIKNNELHPAYFGGKKSRLDVLVTFNDGEIADLEMQNALSGDNLRKRAEFYTAQLLSAQLPKGKKYESIKRVYQIFFLNCVLFPESAKFARRYFYQEEEEHDRLSEASEIIFYEFPKLEQKFRDSMYNSLETLTVEEKWCMYIKYRHEESAGTLINQLCHKEVGIMHAERAVRKANRDYRRYIENMNIIRNDWDREQLKDEAEERGVQRGEQKGREEIARKLMEMGLSTEQIKTATGVDPLSINCTG
jgi:predicted transposase/invertase (TIGR01784 family)